MKNAMFVGMAIGMVVGACWASNSKKTRQVVVSAQDQIMNKICPDCQNGSSEYSQSEQQ